MKPTGWRTTSLVLGTLCLIQLWRGCNAPEPVVSDCRTATAKPERPVQPRARVEPAADEPAPAPPPSNDGTAATAFGIAVPSWALWLAPHPGEDLRAYRDRMLPLAQAVIAPQRARVARSRDSFTERAQLDAHQRAELEAAAQDAAAAIQDRVLAAVLGGELMPATFKPMAGVTVARDILDIVGRGNRRFLDALHDDQRAQLTQQPFDFGDYLVFSTRWEDALKLLD